MSSLLTTLTRFKAYSGITGTTQDALITNLISSVSAQVERYLRRTLESTSYKIWLDGSGAPGLRLHQYPITALYQVCVGNSSIAQIGNTSSTVSRASVSCDGTNLTLVEISTLGVETITDLLLATYPSINSLITIVNTKAGWTGTLQSASYGTLPSSMLRPIYGQNALNALADLVVPDAPVQVKIVYEDLIEIINSDIFPTWDIFPNDRQPNRMSAIQPGITPATFSYGFPPGTKNIFVWYRAGYTLPTDAVTTPTAVPASDGTLPAGLAMIVNQILWDCLASTKLNSNLKSESIGDYSYTMNATANGAIASAVENHKKDLNQYRRVSI